MNLRTLAISMLGALALGLPASSKIVGAAETQFLRIATLAPRDSDLAKGFMKLDQGMKKATNNAWGVRLYPSGVAGDEVDVLRKMKIGQMDASLITGIGLSQVVRETTLLTVPGLISNYKEWDAVRTALTPEYDSSFEKAGYKLLAWGETGALRMFAKAPLEKPSSLKNMRPWLWPQAHAQKEMLNAIGANGVPLGVPEVYGALQTGMVDQVTGTCVTLVSLQWHSTLKYLTKESSGVLPGAMLLSGEKWKSLPPDVQKIVQDEVTRNQAADRDDIRKADDRSCAALIKRGYTENSWASGEPKKEADTMFEAVQKRLVGRMYTAEQLDRVKKLAA
ncbi:MAG: TRAP transporter substrate-binding protein DctP, partial [Polyangiales bacterium]